MQLRGRLPPACATGRGFALKRQSEFVISRLLIAKRLVENIPLDIAVANLQALHATRIDDVLAGTSWPRVAGLL